MLRSTLALVLPLLALLTTGCFWGPPPCPNEDIIGLPEPSEIGAVLLTEDSPSDLGGRNVNMIDAVVSDDYLIVTVQYSGGGAPHDYACYMSPGRFSSSSAAHADLFIRDSGPPDMGLVIVTESPAFDLSSLSELYYQQYGKHGWIELHIYDQNRQTRVPKFSLYYKPSSE